MAEAAMTARCSTPTRRKHQAPNFTARWIRRWRVWPDSGCGPWWVVGAMAHSFRTEAYGGTLTPAMLAKQAATVDAISGGRLILGLGAGWNEREYQAFGFPYDHRVSRFNEAFTIIRRLLREGRVDFDSEYYRVEQCVLDPGPARPGGPPLMLGSTSPRMMRIGLPHVDAWNVWWSDYGNTPEGFAAVRDRVDEAAVQAGRTQGEVAATAAVLVSLPGGTGRLMGNTYNAPVRPVQGSPADIGGHLDAMASAGATHLQLVVDPITQGTIEMLAEALATLDRG